MLVVLLINQKDYELFIRIEIFFAARPTAAAIHPLKLDMRALRNYVVSSFLGLN